MSQEEEENLGTGLRDVYDILDGTALDRVTSLTFQMGESPAEIIIHAFCLIILRRQEQALNKLQMLGDSYHVKHLAEILEKSEGELADFRVSLDVTGESPRALARIFRVLSEQGLCEPVRRNLAYKRAVSTDNQIWEDQEYNQLKEEARDVCGPEFAAWMSSLKSFPDPSGSVVERTLKVYGDSTRQIEDLALPCPLQASCSEPSYPTHLEISATPTAILKEDGISPEQSPALPLARNDPEQSPAKLLRQPEPPSGTGESVLSENKKLDELPCKPGPATDTSPPPEANIILPKTLLQPNTGSLTEEEEEVMFYPFVILHAPEDTEAAEAIKEKMETVIGADGATFSEDFAIPGRSTLRCIEDAINNSAFTVLLLTRNFNTRMLEVKTESALINSLHNKHKYNTVIPLVPSENRLPKDQMPLVLKTLVPLEESKSFEKKLRKVFSPAKLKAQKRLWVEQQRTLLRHNQQRHLLQASKATQSQEHAFSHCDFAGALPMWQQKPNIHIENAKYIMIGNDSRMTVDHGCSLEKDD
ncbi:TIR domain-containing adapter molecule 1 [Synchiropus splendidus]|uniref:TIR domain-containing adapter molecule 1 n=1 Tax=Synchiropus splendidus TaxID=270530 RepID=UPI00237D40B2|nr:TIR domain-containing adapter molecule 1 [Synchiropus splendidus]XP_053739297.1 TIR domain-containing adapter molecule 1 [Synchiropus splendidus]